MKKKYLNMSDKMNEDIVLTSDRAMLDEFGFQVSHLQNEAKRVSAAVDTTRATLKDDSIKELNKNRALLS